MLVTPVLNTVSLSVSDIFRLIPLCKTHRLLFSPMLPACFSNQKREDLVKAHPAGSVLASASWRSTSLGWQGRAHVETQTPSSPCGLPRPSQAQRESRRFSYSHVFRKGQQSECNYSHFADKHATPRCRAGGSDGVLKVLSSVWPSQNPLFTGSQHPC